MDISEQLGERISLPQLESQNRPQAPDVSLKQGLGAQRVELNTARHGGPAFQESAEVWRIPEDLKGRVVLRIRRRAQGVRRLEPRSLMIFG